MVLDWRDLLASLLGGLGIKAAVDALWTDDRGVVAGRLGGLVNACDAATDFAST